MGTPEWPPKSFTDFKRDLTAIRQTGYDCFRIRVGFDSKLDEVEQLLNIAHDLSLKVHYGFATFYVPDWFLQNYQTARVVTASGEVLGGVKDTRWTIRKKDGKSAGGVYITRALIRGPKDRDIIASYYDNKCPALFTSHRGKWLIGAFNIGFSYNFTLRKELRQTIASWIRSVGLEPKVKVEGIDEDYRPMIEVNALEHDGRVLLICCNRSPYEWDLKVTVAKYVSLGIKLPPAESRQVFTSAV